MRFRWKSFVCFFFNCFRTLFPILIIHYDTASSHLQWCGVGTRIWCPIYRNKCAGQHQCEWGVFNAYTDSENQAVASKTNERYRGCHCFFVWPLWLLMCVYVCAQEGQLVLLLLLLLCRWEVLTRVWRTHRVRKGERLVVSWLATRIKIYLYICTRLSMHAWLVFW